MNSNDLHEEKYTVYRDKNGAIRRVKREKDSTKKFIGISVLTGVIVITIVLGMARVTGIIPTPNSTEDEETINPMHVQGESVPVTSEDNPNEEEYDSCDLKDGIMFPESSSRYITEDDINNCQVVERMPLIDIIQYSINEIYARNGYDFHEKKWKEHYEKYSWYINKGYNDAETRECFNTFEEQNMQLLIAIREDIRENNQ